MQMFARFGQPPLLVQIEPMLMREPERGLWCDTCLLPSATRLRIAVVNAETLAVLVSPRDALVCGDCGRGKWEDPDVG